MKNAAENALPSAEMICMYVKFLPIGSIFYLKNNDVPPYKLALNFLETAAKFLAPKLTRFDTSTTSIWFQYFSSFIFWKRGKKLIF